MNRQNNETPLTFDQIMDFRTDNRSIYNSIKDRIRSLTPFVGAGMSTPFYKLWAGSLYEILEKISSTKVKRSIKKLIREGQYLEAADRLAEKRSIPNIAQDFAELYSPLKIKDQISTIRRNAVYLLPALFHNMCITTNLDQMLELVYRDWNRDFFGTYLPGERVGLIREYFRDDGHALLKLHGSVQLDGRIDESSIVFTGQQYEHHYRPASDLVKELKTVFISKPLLFLGCSLNQDRTMEVLSEVQQAGMWNYAIVNSDASSSDDKFGQLGKQHIRAIIYPDGHHEAVRIILEKLLEETDPSTYNSLIHFENGLASEQEKKKYQSRFSYTSEYVNTIGRDTELTKLNEFLLSKKNFEWWGITGPAGVGKSRLAWTFTQNLPLGWTSKWFHPSDYSNLDIYSNPTQNTVYVADYVRADAIAVGNWIVKLANIHHSANVRLLLIEREGGDWDTQLRSRFFGDRKVFYSEHLSHEFLKLNNLGTSSILKLMEEYASSVISYYPNENKKNIRREDYKKILGDLRVIDPSLQRPLFAIFLVDIWLSGNYLQAWTREELLKQVLDKEQSLLQMEIEKIIGPNKGGAISKSCLAIWRVATAMKNGSLSDLKQVAPADFQQIELFCERNYFSSLDEFFERIFLTLDSNKRVPPLLPDILGEYFVIHWLLLDQKTSPAEREAFIDRLWRFPSHAAEFMSRMWDDFGGLIIHAKDMWQRLLPNAAQLESNSCAWFANWLAGCFAKDSFPASMLQDAVEFIEVLKECCSDEEDKKSIIRSLAFCLMQLSLIQEIDESQDILNKLESLSMEWVNLPELSLILSTAQMNVSSRLNQKAVSQTIDIAEKYLHETLKRNRIILTTSALYEEVTRVQNLFVAKGGGEEPFSLYCDLVVERKEENYQKAKELLAQYATLYLHGEKIEPTIIEDQLKNALYHEADSLFRENPEATVSGEECRILQEKRRSFSEIFLNEDEIDVSEFTSPHFKRQLKTAIKRNIDFLLSFDKPEKSNLIEKLKENGITYKGNQIVFDEEEREILISYKRKEENREIDNRSMVLLLAVVIPHLEEELDRHYFAAMLQDNLETIAKGWMHDQAIANRVLAARFFVMSNTSDDNTPDQFMNSMEQFYMMIKNNIEKEKGCYLAWGLLLIWISYYIRNFVASSDYLQKSLEIYRNTIREMTPSPFSQKLNQNIEQIVRALFLDKDEEASAIIDSSITLIEDEYQISIKQYLETFSLFRDE